MNILESPYQSDNLYEKGKFDVVWRLNILLSIVFILLAIFFVGGKLEEVIIYSASAVVTLLALVYLYIEKKSKPVYLWLSITGTVFAVFTSNFYTEVVHYGDFLWMVMIVIFSYFGLGIKYGRVFLALNVGGIIYFSIFVVNDNLNAIQPLDFSERIALAFEFSAGILCTMYIVQQILKFHKMSIKELSVSKESIEAKRDLIGKQNDEKTVLIKEIHHRVKNNLQIIISLLRLQKHTLDEDAQLKFDEAISRIMTMSIIHKKLYQTEELAKVDLKSYIEELIAEISSSLAIEKNIECKVTSNLESIGLKTIVPVGLLINELISNSFKHAFENKESGQIAIDIIENTPTAFTLTYTDDGVWKEPIDNSVQFGLGLISTLTEQLEGNCHRDKSHYTFTLKNLDI